jgi:hypothetical protein
MTRGTCKLLRQAHVGDALRARRLAHELRKINEQHAERMMWDRVNKELASARRYHNRLKAQEAA